MTTIETHIQPFLEKVNETLKSEVAKLVYDIRYSQLEQELEKCKTIMAQYKSELDLLKVEYQNMLNPLENISLEQPENISLEIEEKIQIVSLLEKINIIEHQEEEEDQEEEKEEEELEDQEEEEEDQEEEEEEEVEEEEEEKVEEEVEEEEKEEEDQEKVEEEEEQEEEEEEEEEQEQDEEEEEEQEQDEEEEEVFEIEIDDVTYYATSEENGPIYNQDQNGDPGNKVGYLKDGEPFFY